MKNKTYSLFIYTNCLKLEKYECKIVYKRKKLFSIGEYSDKLILFNYFILNLLKNEVSPKNYQIMYITIV